MAKQASSGEPPVNPNGGPSEPVKPTSQPTQSSAKSRLRNSAFYTHMSTALLVVLVVTLNETKSNVERRFSLTAREREQELFEQANPTPAPVAAVVDGAAEEEEEEERIYNPLKLPLGWDGKPIPYWLYKLHGLGVEYRCEICSDHVYMGRSVIFFTYHANNDMLLGKILTDISRQGFCRFISFYLIISTGISTCIRHARSWPS